MKVTMPHYITRIDEMLPGAKIIKLTGYANGNQGYQKAKTPVCKWKDSQGLDDLEINKWINQGGWIGAVIPQERIIIDVDDQVQGELVKGLLEGENRHHHSIKTPNGWQFVFAAKEKRTQDIKQITKFFSQIGVVIDTRTAGAGYIVFPTNNTEGRYIATNSIDQLDELPHYLIPVRNTDKSKDYMFPVPIESSGSRNDTLYKFATHLKAWNVPNEEIMQAMELIYEYFLLDKTDFPYNELKTLTQSAIQWIPDQSERQHISENNFETHAEGKNENKIIPKPFKVGNKGTLFETREDKDGNEITKLVSRKTPYITKEFHNIERPQVLYEIEWKESNRTVREVVPASTIAVRKELLELSDKGFSVNDNNVKKIITYFDHYLLINSIEQHYAVERLGHIKDTFIHPLVTKDVEIMAIDHGEKQLLEAFEVKGTSDTWKKEVFERIKQQPKAVFFVLSSFASVIIKDLRLQPFIVDLSGTTSQGKTTTLKVAASVWGNESLMSEWNATKVSIERKSAYLNSFPLLMDDTRKADERILKDVIYSFSGGRSKGRGSLKGSQREFTWHNILLSTGEVSLNEYAKNQGGAAARIIPLIDEPLKKDHSNIMGLYEAMENNYGAIGRDFLKVWLRDKKELITEYHKFRKHYVDKAKGNEVLSRLAGYYAAVHFTGSILKNKMDFDIDLKAISLLFDDIAEENKSIDKPLQFLEEILTDLDSSRQNIFYDYMPKIIKAIYKDKQRQLFLTPAYTTDFLGVEEKQVRREWLKRGMTIPVEKGSKVVDYKLVSHKGKKFNGIPLNMELVGELGFDFYEANIDFSD
ncbi:DUF927 domain-containing protein [Bacillus thuringiensis]|uniref:DUF927 domain-containing protein n=1 Tax=Bacillus thuringiensis serovar toumanoffi TaxID=180862 RepID=A0ABD5I6Q9_BACTU|nr:DUF927 domain-containing protein [Bacillus thuringiensis]MCR6782683.1 DUF927 domain-containing protein [Bacillus thuringiensis]MCR6860754.1 DUF927 domain-containing protein [Bacillus thuringiensis]MCR6864025.1 DUF927 domain-containing protein [Bacillus thuringiensis]MDW9212807.1 DUF927 domain-containing protein [Bacillus thuringiensis serovar toumanoffi]MED2621188.1 DUF927 domain-containing protein [Bacillus thuringiensis]